MNPDDPDYMIEYLVEKCSSRYSSYLQLIMYTIKGIVLIFGVFLAWQTRKVSIPALNDSKYIGESTRV